MSVMKKITAPRKIEVSMQAMSGETKNYECAEITPEMQRQIYEIAGRDVDGGQQNREICAVFFGGMADDYLCYDGRVLTQAIKFMTEQIRNPQ